MEERRQPSLERYLASLPIGVDSHPHCQAKASLVHSALGGMDSDAVAAVLPEPVAEMVRSLPPASFWVPAVWSDAVFHAVCDTHFETEDAILEWCYERTAQMSRNPIYRGFMKVVGPSRIFRIGPKVHRLIQRGTSLRNHVEPGRVVSRVGFPSHLHDRLNSLSNVPVIRALAELTGGKNVQATLREYDAVSAVYECTWE